MCLKRSPLNCSLGSSICLSKVSLALDSFLVKVLSNVLANNVDSVSNEMIRNARAIKREISQNKENNKKSLEMTSENE